MTITQVQKDAIVLAKDSYTVGSEGGQLHIEVGHNIDFDISIDVDWITQNVSRSYGTSVLMFNVAENTDSNSREGIITFASKDGTITQKVKITQKKYSSFDSSIDDWEEDEGNYGGSAE